MQNPPSRGLWYDTASVLPGALVLCLASLASGGLGALFAIRCLYTKPAPTFWELLRLIFAHTVGR
jgi:hypothetical protein